MVKKKLHHQFLIMFKKYMVILNVFIKVIFFLLESKTIKLLKNLPA